MKSSFWKSGHTPTLFAAFLYFDLSFMVWYLLGPTGGADRRRPAPEHPATRPGGGDADPAGAVLRFLMGMLADRLSPKTAGLIGQVIVIAHCSAPGNWASTAMSRRCCWAVPRHGRRLVRGGAAAGLAVVSAQHQGKAMGIAGAGNSGTVFAALLAPVLAAAFGWSNVFGLP
jgi:NNP family nitrate/nitrite transporter-like MFS transporter